MHMDFFFVILVWNLEFEFSSLFLRYSVEVMISQICEVEEEITC